jgi:AAA+ ATPase superfamily predicted ATPase
MYFDLRPKNNLKDLYDFEQPFAQLMGLLRDRRARAPLIMVTGLRRTGKTSLIKTCLAESGLPYLSISGHAFAEEPTIGKRSLMVHLERELNSVIQEQGGWREKILGILRGIRWLRVNSEFPWIHFEWEKATEDFDVLDLLYSFNRLAEESGTKALLVIDEAQEFRKLKRYSLQKLMAFAYDELDHIQMIVSGSQFGLLQDFLGANDPTSPLYGRGALEIRVPRLPQDRAVDFLQKGFQQVGIRPDPTAVESAVRRLDGIIGWLTFFGAVSAELGTCSEKVLEETMERGSRLSLKEFQNFLRLRPGAEKRYVYIMEAAARLGKASWTDLKRNLEVKEHKAVADKVFTNLLENLLNSEYLRKNEDGTYSLPDPMLAHALTRARKH